MFGINVHDKSHKRKLTKIYKKPIYPIRIESKAKVTTATPRTTTEAPTVRAVGTSETMVGITFTTSPPPSTTTTGTAEELQQPADESYAAYDESYAESYDAVPSDVDHTHVYDGDYGDNEGYTEDHAMMEKMYLEADGDPEVMEASGDGDHFHDLEQLSEHETLGFPEFQYEPTPHASLPQLAPSLPARRADHVTYREGDRPVPHPPAPGEHTEPAEQRPRRPVRPAGASSWMTGLLSSLFSRPREPEPPSPVSLLSGLFGGGGSSERRPPPPADPYGFAPPPDNDPLATSASESVAVTDANGEPLRPPAAFRNVPALAGLFAGLPAADRPRFPAAARQSSGRPVTVRPVFFAKRQETAEADSTEVSAPYEYVSTLDSLRGRLPEPSLVHEPTAPPQLVATRVPLQ